VFARPSVGAATFVDVAPAEAAAINTQSEDEAPPLPARQM
jgi:hypothetical protein